MALFMTAPFLRVGCAVGMAGARRSHGLVAVARVEAIMCAGLGADGRGTGTRSGVRGC